MQDHAVLAERTGRRSCDGSGTNKEMHGCARGSAATAATGFGAASGAATAAAATASSSAAAAAAAASSSGSGAAASAAAAASSSGSGAAASASALEPADRAPFGDWDGVGGHQWRRFSRPVRR